MNTTKSLCVTMIEQATGLQTGQIVQDEPKEFKEIEKQKRITGILKMKIHD